METHKQKTEKTINNKKLMDDAINAGNSVLLEEQARLLRECRLMLDELILKKERDRITGLWLYYNR